LDFVYQFSKLLHSKNTFLTLYEQAEHTENHLIITYKQLINLLIEIA